MSVLQTQREMDNLNHAAVREAVELAAFSRGGAAFHVDPSASATDIIFGVWELGRRSAAAQERWFSRRAESDIPGVGEVPELPWPLVATASGGAT